MESVRVSESGEGGKGEKKVGVSANVGRSESGIRMGYTVQCSTASAVRYLVVCTDCWLPHPWRAGLCLKCYRLSFNDYVM